MNQKTTTIRQTVEIAASPQEVYEALMDQKKHSEFTKSKAVIDPKVGGEFTSWDGYISGRNLELAKGKKIVQEWSTTEWPEGYPPSVVEFSLSRKGSGTELIMVQSNVPEEQMEYLKQGWIDFYWEPMKEYFSKKTKR